MGFRSFGNTENIQVTVHLDAATAVDRNVWICPTGNAYRLVGIREVHAVVGGASAAVRPRRITDTSAPGAAASSTVIEQSAAIDLTASINVVRDITLTATDRTFLPGNRLALDASGTVAGLVGCVIQFIFEPVSRRL